MNQVILLKIYTIHKYSKHTISLYSALKKGDIIKNILEKECISTLTEVPWTGDEGSKGESDYQKGILELQRPFVDPSFFSTRDELRVSMLKRMARAHSLYFRQETQEPSTHFKIQCLE